MSIIYLDVDDEITSAAAQIRTADAVELALVLQAGSRIATSRINFKLLAREAREHGRRIAIVAPDAAARALAASAELPVFATVMEYEEAARGGGPVVSQERKLTPDEIEARDPDAGGGAGGGARAHSVRDGGTRGTLRAVVATGGAAAAAIDAGRASDVTRQAPPRRPLEPSTGMGERVISVTPRRRRPWKRIILFAVVMAAVVIGGVVGYTVLPAATVTLAVRTDVVGPVQFEVRAAATVTDVDATTGAIPARSFNLGMSATGTFKATGKRIAEAAATGSVQWCNYDPTQSYTIPQGTIVRTQTGAAFTTDEAVFLPVATLTNSTPPQVNCQPRNVAITASKPGLAGNVPRGAISVVPGSYNSVVIRVQNLSSTTGGTHQEFPRITDKDVAAALAALDKQLAAQLPTAVADAGAPGVTIYPTTAIREDAVPTTDATALVGQEQEQFDLGATAKGTVLGVDPGPIQAIGKLRADAAVPGTSDLVAGSEQVQVADGVAQGQEITFAVTATASSMPRIDEGAIRATLKGRTAAEARDALSAYGDATVELWPDWSNSITTLDMRLSLKVVGLADGTAPSPTPVAAPVATPVAAPEFHSCLRAGREPVAGALGIVRRLLGIDLGTVRIGLALAEPDALRARPLTTIARGRSLEADAAALARIAGSSGVGEIVVGLPIDMSGTEGDAARACRAWAVEMATRLGLPVRLRDERLSSHVAESRLGPARRGHDGGPPGRTRRAAHRARIDREAATVILEDELEARAHGEPGELVAAENREPADRDASKSGTIDRTAGGGAAAGQPEEPV